MPTVREQIELVLRSIKKSQQSMKVKTSVFLKKIEELMFPQGGATPKLAPDDINVLFRGIEGEEVYGLMQLCGNKGTLSGMKKSSFYAIELLYRCLVEPKNKEEYVKSLTESDSDEFKSMRLATHIIEKKTDTALKICAVIKEKRYHLNLGEYVYSEEAQQVFIQWFKQYETKKKAENQKNVQWQQEGRPQEGHRMRQGGPPGALAQNNAAIVVRKGLRYVAFYEYYIPGDDPIDVMVDTFVDPIELVVFAHNSKDKLQRVKIQAKRAVYYLLNTPMSNRDSEEIRKNITKLHIDSEKFDARFLLSSFHQEDTKDQLQKVSKLLDCNYYQYRYCKYTLHRINFVRLCEMEALFQDMQKFFGRAESVTEKASIGFAVRTQIKNSISKLAESGNPVVWKFEESEKVRKFIVFLESNIEFVRLPKTFKQLQDAGDYKLISSLFKKHHRIIRSYRGNPLVRRLVYEIMTEVRNIRHRHLEKCVADLSNFEQLEADLQILIGLFEYNILEEYLLEKMPCEFVKEVYLEMEKIAGKTIELKFPMMDALPKKELVMFGEVQTLNIRNMQSEGDKILEWYSERKLKTEDPSKQSISLHFTKFYAMVLKAQNLLKLYAKVVAGDYDNQLSKPKKESYRHQDLLRMRTLLGDTLILWYQQLFTRLREPGEGLEGCLLLSKMLDQIAKLYGKELTALQDDNFREYVKLHKTLLKASLSSEAQIAKTDMNGYCHNDLVYRNLGLLLERLEVVSKNPLYNQKFLKPDILQFVEGVFEPTLSKPRSKYQCLTFLCGLHCIQENRTIVPYLIKFNSVLGLNDQTIQSHLLELTDKHLKIGVTELLGLLAVEYRYVVYRHKNGYLALSILDVISDNLFLLAEYAPNCFVKLKSLLLGVFTSEVARVRAKEEQTIKFYIEIELVQLMTNRLQSKQTTQKFTELLAAAPVPNEYQKKAKDNYLLKTRHRMQSRYQSLMDY